MPDRAVGDHSPTRPAVVPRRVARTSESSGPPLREVSRTTCFTRRARCHRPATHPALDPQSDRFPLRHHCHCWGVVIPDDQGLQRQQRQWTAGDDKQTLDRAVGQGLARGLRDQGTPEGRELRGQAVGVRDGQSAQDSGPRLAQQRVPKLDGRGCP